MVYFERKLLLCAVIEFIIIFFFILVTLEEINVSLAIMFDNSYYVHTIVDFSLD